MPFAFAVAFMLSFIFPASASIDNTSTAQGSLTSGGAIINFGSSGKISVPVATSSPALTLVKTAAAPVDVNGNGILDAGDTIAYSFLVTNTGNVTLSGIAVTDSKVKNITCSSTTLTPSQSVTCTGNVYVITQADMDAGQISNTATASGTPPTGAPITVNSSPSATSAIGPTVTTLAPTAQMTVTKVDSVPNPAVVGGSISYTFTIKNTGSVTLSNITLADAGATVTGTKIASLAPGASDTTTFTAAHTIVTADLASGNYKNTATASGTTPSGATVSASGSVTSTFNLNTSMTFAKSGVLANGTTAPPKAGDKVNYTFTVTNNGSSALYNVTITDPMLSALNSPNMMAMLDGAKSSHADAIMTAATDVASLTSGIVNASNRRYSKLAVTPTKSPTLEISRILIRLSGENANLQPGDKIGFVYSLKNASDDVITNIHVTQPGANAYANGLSQLAGGASNSNAILFTRELTAQEFTSGKISSHGYVTFESKSTKLLEQADETLALSALTKYEDIATASITPATTPQLNPGQSYTATAPYTLTQANIDAGVVNNLAQATAKDIANNALTKTASASIALTQKPLVGVVKTSSITPKNGTSIQVGDVINYKFAITNLGNVTLTNVSIVDAPVTLTGSPIATLAPGVTDSTTYTAQYVIKQADIDAGTFQNQATVNASAPGSVSINALSDNADPTQHNPTITSLTSTPAIALLKQVSKVIDTNNNGKNDIGDVIQYQFTVTNTGNVTLNNVTITDTIGGGANVLISGSPIASLAPGASSTAVTGSYTITQADMDTGHVNNTATATGTAPNGTKVSVDSDPGVGLAGPTIQNLSQTAQVKLYKKQINVVDTNHDGIIDAGDVIQYQFIVQNTGTVTLSNFSLVDALPGVQVTNNSSGVTLAPGASSSTMFSASYTVTTADEQAGTVSNSATVTANGPSGTGSVSVASVNGDLTNSVPGPTTTNIQHTPTIATLLLTPSYADTNGNSVADSGDTLTYAVKVKNTSSIPLTNVSVVGISSGLTINGTLSATLLPGQEDTATFTATHVLTPADLTAGQYNAQVQVSANPVVAGYSGSLPLITSTSDFTDYAQHRLTPFLIVANPLIQALETFDHFTDANGNTVPAGATGYYAVYKVTLHNVGNIDFTDVSIAEAAGYTGTIGGTHPFALAAGATDTTHFTVSHLITNAEMLAGQASNQLSVTGINAAKGNSATVLSDPTTPGGHNLTIVPLQAKPSFAVIKSASVIDTNGNGANDPGDVINYTFQITNTGNVNLSNIAITDPTATLPNPSPVLATLPVGASDTTTFLAVHTITVADMSSASYSNQASFSASFDPTKPPIIVLSDGASLTANPPMPTLVTLSYKVPTLTKTAARSQVKRGEVINYTITASNLATGQYQLADIMPPGFGYVQGSAQVNGVAFAPVVSNGVVTFNGLVGAAGSFTVTLNLTASSTLGTGKFINNAKLINPANNAVVANAQATVEILPDPAFDCSDIIGHVFENTEGDGYFHDGNKGIAGVKVVTVNGLVVTTDTEGRFHIPCASIPEPTIGSNFIMKLDPHSLPVGYKMTTENPRIVRLTRGKMTEINFGAVKLHDVKLDVSGSAYNENSIDLKQNWQSGVWRLIAILKQQPSTLHITYHKSGESQNMIAARMTVVEDMIKTEWHKIKDGYTLKITANVEEGQ